MQFQNTSICPVHKGVLYLICVTLQWNTHTHWHTHKHTHTHTMKKQSERVSGDLKPKHKKTTNTTTMSPTTDTDGQAPTIWNRLRREPSLAWEPSHRREIKEGSKAIIHNWVYSHACSYPQNIHVAIYFFEVSDDLFKLYGSFFCQHSF